MLVLAEAARQGQARGAHAIRDHEDEVSLPARLALLAMVRRDRLVVLRYDGQDDNSCRGYDGPRKETDLTPKGPFASWTLAELTAMKGCIFRISALIRVLRRGSL
jgi:hypothetical protein